MRLVLASRSPRRREILGWLGIDFEVVEPDAEELTAGLDPEGLVLENARRKAAAGLDALDGATDAVVLGVDTDVFIDGEMLGQPPDRAAAEDRLRRLSGRAHEVLSGLCLLGPRAQEIPGAPVRLRAGGYAIQGLGSILVDRVEGDFSNVVGLPVRLLLELDPALPVAMRENPKANN